MLAKVGVDGPLRPLQRRAGCTGEMGYRLFPNIGDTLAPKGFCRHSMGHLIVPLVRYIDAALVSGMPAPMWAARSRANGRAS
jgi:hypothetical protein